MSIKSASQRIIALAVLLLVAYYDHIQENSFLVQSRRVGATVEDEEPERDKEIIKKNKSLEKMVKELNNHLESVSEEYHLIDQSKVRVEFGDTIVAINGVKIHTQEELGAEMQKAKKTKTPMEIAFWREEGTAGIIHNTGKREQELMELVDESRKRFIEGECGTGFKIESIKGMCEICYEDVQSHEAIIPSCCKGDDSNPKLVCRSCLERTYREKNSCPFCRQDLTKEDRKKLKFPPRLPTSSPEAEFPLSLCSACVVMSMLVIISFLDAGKDTFKI